MKRSDIDVLLSAFAADSLVEDALIAELDRQFEAAKAAGTLPNTDAAFARFMARRQASTMKPQPKEEMVAVVFRRYMMAADVQAADIVRDFHVSNEVVSVLLGLRVPFNPDNMEHVAMRLAEQCGERVQAVNVLLKEVAAHHFARVSRAPVLLAARKGPTP